MIALRDVLWQIDVCYNCEKVIKLFERACYLDKPIKATSLLLASDFEDKQHVLQQFLLNQGKFWKFEVTQVQKAWKDGVTGDWTTTERFKQDVFFPTNDLKELFEKEGYDVNNVSPHGKADVEVFENGDMRFFVDKEIAFSKKVSDEAREFIKKRLPKKQDFIDKYGVTPDVYQRQQEVEVEDDEKLIWDDIDDFINNENMTEVRELADADEYAKSVFAEGHWHDLVSVNPFELEKEQLKEKFDYIVKTNSPLIDQENYELFLSGNADPKDPRVIEAKKDYVKWMTFHHKTILIQQIENYLENKKD